MGDVYLARQLSLDRLVAVKVLRREAVSKDWLLERLGREARILAGLRHPNLITVHDFVHVPNGQVAVVMEWLEGGNLRARICASPGTLPWTQVRDWAREIAAALTAAHSAGIVHRDVKPENILLDAKGHVRVGDFGMALPLEAGTRRLTGSGGIAGTPGYLAPEQMTDGPLDIRVDVFGFGVLIYELLTGSLPVGRFSPVHQLRPEVPRWLDDLLDRSLRPDLLLRLGDLQPWILALGTADPELVLAGTASGSGSGLGDQPEAGTPVGGPTPWLPHTSSRRRWLIRLGWVAAMGTGVAYVIHRAVRTNSPWRQLAWPSDLEASALSGSWARDGSGVRSDDSIAVLRLVDPWPAQFQLRFGFRRLSGSHSAALFFRQPEGHGSLEFDAWGRNLGGIQAIDDVPLDDSSAFPCRLEVDVAHEVEWIVRDGVSRIVFDGVSHGPVSWRGRKLSIVTPWNLAIADSRVGLALGTFRSSFLFESLEWRELS